MTPRTPKPSVKSVTRFCGKGELQRIFNTAKRLYGDTTRGRLKGFRMYVLLVVLFYTAGRLGEVLSLRKEQFRLVSPPLEPAYILVVGMVVFKKEQHTTRDVLFWLDDPWVRDVWLYIRTLRFKEGPLFPMSPDTVQRAVHKIDPAWWPHRFRAERLWELGGSGLRTPELMDYTKADDLKSFKRYGRIAGETLGKMIRRSKET